MNNNTSDLNPLELINILLTRQGRLKEEINYIEVLINLIKKRSNIKIEDLQNE